MKNKKAQGLPLNVIIIAAIAIVVLIVILLIFSGRFGTFNEATKDCQLQGGIKRTGECNPGEISIPMGNGEYCCKPMGT